MKLKDVLKKNFNDNELLLLKRFKSAKFLFAVTALLFFSNYFLVASFPENDFFIVFLPSMYVAFVFAFVLFSYFSVKKFFYGKINNTIFIAFLVLLLIIGLILSIPFLVDNNLIKNLF